MSPHSPVRVFALACVLAPSILSASSPALTDRDQQKPGPALRIVVIEGEGAVNIIQQKTAVAPMIEVRDRNDQPVAGATVNFVVRAGRATFGGARTLTVTTNAAGRAAAAGFAPSGTGALQIGATATFQGQTAAVAIAQTNVMTAAEAAAVSSAGAGGAGGSGGAGSAAGGGAGAGGGGGLSATTIGIVGGAVAGGAVVAQQALSSGTIFIGQFSGVMPDTDTSAPGFGPFSCTRNQSLTGTLRFVLESTDGALNGTMNVNGESQLSPGNCPPDTYNTGRFGFGLKSGSVTGSRENTTGSGRFQENTTTTTPPGAGMFAWDYTFTGRFDGDDQISGALVIVRTGTWRNADGSYAGISYGTITPQVTLRKQ